MAPGLCAEEGSLSRAMLHLVEEGEGRGGTRRWPLPLRKANRGKDPVGWRRSARGIQRTREGECEGVLGDPSALGKRVFKR